MFRKILFVVLAVIMVAAVFAGCAAENAEPAGSEDAAVSAESDWAGIEAEGKMVIGYTVYDPMNYFDENGEFIGFDTEYATAVCEYLGIEPDFVEINWDTKEIELAAGNIDAIWNGLTITEERKENMLFTTPYMKNKQVIVIKKDNADKFKTTADLADATVSAESGSTGEESILTNEDMAMCNFVGVTKQTDALLEVMAGTSDAAVIDFTTADAMVGEGTDYADLMMIPDIELSVEEYSVGCRLGSDTADKINEATEALYADGTMKALAEKYELEALLYQ